MRIITFLNEKGGVGKTSLAIHVAAGLAILGRRVMLIDADPQAHATQQLAQAEYGGLYRLLIQQEEWKPLLKKVHPEIWAGENLKPKGFLWLLPGNIETRAIPMLTADAMCLRLRLEELSSFVDAVVIDTSPTPSMLQTILYLATDELVYPTQCQALSLNGLAASTSRMSGLNAERRRFGLVDAALLGIVPTMYRHTLAHQKGLEFIETAKAFHGKVLPAMSHLTVWQEREYNQQTLFAYAPEHQATQEAWELVQRVNRYQKAGV